MTGLTGTSLIFDSSAWIEYFLATKMGEKVRKLVDTPGQEIFTPNIVAAEVVSRMSRSGADFESAAVGIHVLSRPPRETQDDYLEAGKRHKELKEKFGNISLADAIILVLAEKNGSRIVTKDFHLKSFNSIFLE